MAARSAFVASARVRDLLVHAKRVFVVAKAQAGITARPTSGSSTGSSAGSSRSTKQRTATIINRFNIFSILRAVKNGSVSREGGSQRGNCATAAVTALVASARVWILLVHAKHLFVVANCAAIPGANVGDFPTCCLEVFPAGSKILWGWPTQQ
jgi:hypothetical protein